MTTILLSLLLGCSSEQPTRALDRRDWELYTPAFDREPILPSTITWSADPELVDGLTAAGSEWRQHLSCGVELRRVDGDADVDFRCEDFEIVPNTEARSLSFPREGHISVNPQACARGGHELMIHAWGHALGLQHREEWFDTRMSAVGIVLEQRYNAEVDGSWDPVETDGFRIWALQSGAPGCGPDELEWSWITDPDLYRNPPPIDVAERLIELSSRGL